MKVECQSVVWYKAQLKDVPFNALIYQNSFEFPEDTNGARRVTVGQRHADRFFRVGDGFWQNGSLRQIFDGETTFSFFTKNPAPLPNDVEPILDGSIIHNVVRTTQGVVVSIFFFGSPLGKRNGYSKTTVYCRQHPKIN